MLIDISLISITNQFIKFERNRENSIFDHLVMTMLTWHFADIVFSYFFELLKYVFWVLKDLAENELVIYFWSLDLNKVDGSIVLTKNIVE